MIIFERLTTFLIILGVSLSLACGSLEKVGQIISIPSASPVPEVKIPADFKEFEIGPFCLFGPSDLKNRKVWGIDSEAYRYENREFTIGMDISSGFYDEKFELEEHSYQHDRGTIVINGRNVPYIKGNMNSWLPMAARNADGKASPRPEKSHFITVFIAEAYSVVSVNYRSETSTDSAFAILQSIKVKPPNR